MAIKLVYEALEIEKLLDEEKAAKDKGPIAEQNLEDKKVEQAIKEKKEEDGGDPITPVDTPEDKPDSSEEDPGSTPPETEEPTDVDTEDAGESDQGGEKEPSNEEIPEKDTPAQESLRHLGGDDLTIESFSETAKGLGGGVLNSLQWAVGSLSTLTSLYGTKILRAMYRGVIYAFAKLIDSLGKMFTALDKSIERHKLSVKTLRARLAELKKLIEQIEAKGELQDLSITYGKRDVVNALKTGESLDIEANLKAMGEFTSTIVKDLHKSILKEVESIRYMSNHPNSTINFMGLLKVTPPPTGFLLGRVEGYGTEQDNIVSYRTGVGLPGDVVAVVEVPSQDISSLEEYEAAYKQSSIFLAIDRKTFTPNQDVKVEGFDNVKKLVVMLEGLINSLESQQVLYGELQKLKPSLLLSIKRHVMVLVESNTKIRYKDSLVGPMYLKSLFIAKVYLSGALDIHDYVARTISHGLTLVEDLAKKYR